MIDDRQSNNGEPLEPAFGAQPLAYPANFRLAATQGVAVGVNGIAAEHERVGMFDRRPEDKRCIALGLHVDGALGLLEHCDLLGIDRLMRPQLSRIDREPRDGVPDGRLITPSLAVLQANVEIVDARRRTNDASGAACCPMREPWPTTLTSSKPERARCMRDLNRSLLSPWT